MKVGEERFRLSSTSLVYVQFALLLLVCAQLASARILNSFIVTVDGQAKQEVSVPVTPKPGM